MIRTTDLLQPPQFAEKTTLDHPLEHLTACHRRIEDRLATLERVVPHLQTRPEESLAAIDSTFRFFDTNGSWHTADEEESLFPRIAALLNQEERRFVGELSAQHQQAEAIYVALKQTVAHIRKETPCLPQLIEEYKDLTSRLCSIYRAHIQAEDSRIPEIGHRLLGEDALEQISQEMKLRRGLQG